MILEEEARSNCSNLILKYSSSSDKQWCCAKIKIKIKNKRREDEINSNQEQPTTKGNNNDATKHTAQINKCTN
jgi:hypothetical protein